MRHGIVLRAHDDRAEEAHIHLFGGLAVRMRVVPIRAGAALGEIEDVVAACAGGDRVRGIAVLIGGDVEAVPVDRRRLWELVREVDDDVIAFGRDERRAGDRAVVRIGAGGGPARVEGELRDARRERDFDCVWCGR
jgi:hypothetical protein